MSIGGLTIGGFDLPIAQNSRSGFLGGAQVGYNYQLGWAVFGIQGDIAGMDVKGTTPCLVILSCTSKSDWLATASARIGGLVGDRTLVYVKGGGAWLHGNQSASLPFAIPGFGSLLTSADSTSAGLLLGFGTEYAFSKNWSGFIEYDYMDFQKKNVEFPLRLLPVSLGVDVVQKLSIAKAGVNYRF